MKKTINIFLFHLFLLILSNSAISEGFNDNYVEIGYKTDNTKFVDNGIIVKVSKKLDNNLILSGAYQHLKGDWNDPGEYETATRTDYALGIGKSYSINSETEILAELGIDHLVSKKVCTPTTGVCGVYSDGGKSSGNFYYTAVALRHHINNSTDGLVKYYKTIPGSRSLKVDLASVQLVTKISKDKSIVVDYLTNVDATYFKEYFVSIRHSF